MADYDDALSRLALLEERYNAFGRRRITGYLEKDAIVEALGELLDDVLANGQPPYFRVVVPWDTAGRNVIIRPLSGAAAQFEWGVPRAQVKRWHSAPKTREALERWLTK